MTFPGKATAFEDQVDDYDAARPRYPSALYDAFPWAAGSNVLELGAGTGLASEGLVARGDDLVMSDLGPRMLARGLAKHSRPGVLCRAEALPFPDRLFDAVLGAQMWHWTVPPAAQEVARVLRPGAWLALVWNELQCDGLPWFDRQQTRIEAGNPHYTRGYRDRDWSTEIGRPFVASPVVELAWSRQLDLDLYKRWLRSKSYVQALPDVDAFVAACSADLLEAFPDGQVVEPFTTRLFLFQRP